MFFEIIVLKSFQISQENTCVEGSQDCNFIKEILQHRFFPVILRIIQEHLFCGRPMNGWF